MSNYLTLSELKGWKVSGVVVDLTDFTDPELQEFIDLAEADIENITNDIFYSLTATYRFDGNGKYALYYCRTPQSGGGMVNYRNLSITSLKLVDLDGTEEDELTEDDDFVVFPFYVELSREFNGSGSWRGRRFNTHGTWPRGQRNIEIVGTWGWSSTPPGIKRATALLALEAGIPGSTGLPNPNVKQHTWPDLSITYRGGNNYGSDTGYADVDRILKRYINHISAFTNITPEGKDEDFF